MRPILFALLLLPLSVLAQSVPNNALRVIPILKEEQQTYWPTHPCPATQAAQIEKETCITLKHRRCWTEDAELKTSREYGFGLGQFTVTYNKDGSERFNTWRDMRNTFPTALKDWTWENRKDARLSLRAQTLFNRSLHGKLGFASDPEQRLRFTYAAYNRGLGGILSDRRLCARTPNCDPNTWENRPPMLGVASTSLAAKTALQGYGKSFFEINREYVVHIMDVRVIKYYPLFNSTCWSES